MNNHPHTDSTTSDRCCCSVVSANKGGADELTTWNYIREPPINSFGVIPAPDRSRGQAPAGIQSLIELKAVDSGSALRPE
jgi:hypothetical protein